VDIAAHCMHCAVRNAEDESRQNSNIAHQRRRNRSRALVLPGLRSGFLRGAIDRIGDHLRLRHEDGVAGGDRSSHS
jgi:hypothetical protein